MKRNLLVLLLWSALSAAAQTEVQPFALSDVRLLPSRFLPQGKKFQVTIYNDDPTLNTRTKVRTSTKTIKAGTSLQLQLQPSGGAALHFAPVSK